MSSVMSGVVPAQTAASSASKRSTAWRKSVGLMEPVPECFLSSRSNFFSHLVADCPFFPVNGLHNAKSGPFMEDIVRYRAGVGTGLNENQEANNERFEYFVGVLRVLGQGVMEEQGQEVPGLGSVLKLSFQREGLWVKEEQSFLCGGRRYAEVYASGTSRPQRIKRYVDQIQSQRNRLSRPSRQNRKTGREEIYIIRWPATSNYAELS